MTPVWEFLAQPPETWAQYSSYATCSLEKAYDNRESSCSISTEKYEYQICLRQMVQTNATTGKTRPLRRREVLDASAAQWYQEEVARLRQLNDELTERSRKLENENWWLRRNSGIKMLAQLPDCSTMSSAFETRELDQYDHKFFVLQDFFTSSMTRHRLSLKSDRWGTPPRVVVSRIMEVKNPPKQRLYEAARQDVLQRNPQGCSPIPGIEAISCGSSLNEHLLLHGCRLPACDRIAKQGLDPQRGGESVGFMFGKGTYFAQNASKSDMYTTCSRCHDRPAKKCQHWDGERCIVVARVLLGECMMVTQEKLSSNIRAPERPDGTDGELYDSLAAQTKENGGRVDHMEFVIFKEHMALVQYLVYYYHDWNCWCHNCRDRWDRAREA